MQRPFLLSHARPWHAILLGALGLSGCLLDDVTVDENFQATPASGGSTAGGQVGNVQSPGAISPASAGTGMLGAAGAPSAPVVAAGGSSGTGSEGNSNANSSTSIAPGGNGGPSAGTAGTSSAGAGGGSGNGSATTAPTTSVPLDPTYHPEREQACLDYCALYTVVCAGHPANDYTDRFDCANFCLGAPWPVGDLETVVPGTVTCRYFHAGLAKDQGLTPHCYHAARVPTMGGCQVTTP